MKTLAEVIEEASCYFDSRESEEITKNAVLDWMKKIVPGELNVDEYSIAEGWNECRLSILKRIKEERK